MCSMIYQQYIMLDMGALQYHPLHPQLQSHMYLGMLSYVLEVSYGQQTALLYTCRGGNGSKTTRDDKQAGDGLPKKKPRIAEKLSDLAAKQSKGM